MFAAASPALCAAGPAALQSRGTSPQQPHRPAEPPASSGTAAPRPPARQRGASKRHSRGRCQAHPFPSAWRSPFQSLKTRKHNLLATWKQGPGSTRRRAGMQRVPPSPDTPWASPPKRLLCSQLLPLQGGCICIPASAPPSQGTHPAPLAPGSHPCRGMDPAPCLSSPLAGDASCTPGPWLPPLQGDGSCTLPWLPPSQGTHPAPCQPPPALPEVNPALPSGGSSACPCGPQLPPTPARSRSRNEAAGVILHSAGRRGRDAPLG